MSYHQAFNPKVSNIYGRNNNNAQSDKHMKFYGVLGEKKMNFIHKPHMANSPNFMGQKNKIKNFAPSNAYSNNSYSNSQYRILDMHQQNQNNVRVIKIFYIRKGIFHRLKKTMHTRVFRIMIIIDRTIFFKGSSQGILINLTYLCLL